MKDYFKRFVKEDEGAELLEYALVLGIVAALVIIIAVIAAIVKNKSIDSAKALDSANGGDAANWDSKKDNVDELIKQIPSN